MFQTDLLKGKRILITGGGTGLGFSMGQRYLELGAELVICGRRTEVLAEAKAKLEAETGGKVETHGCDIRDAAAVEQMLDCRTVACVAPETRIAESLTYLRLHNEKAEIAFDSIRDPQEMAWIICNYATELQATRVAVVRVSSHIWVRFFSGETARDLLFRVLQDILSPPPLNQFAERAKAFLPSADTTKDGVAHASGPV